MPSGPSLDDQREIVEEKFNSCLTSPSELVLSGKELRDEDMDYLVQLMVENGNIKDVTLSDNKISHIGVAFICDILRGFHLRNEMAENTLSLVHLNFTKNPVCDRGAILLAKALEVNKTLKSLILTNTGIDDEGAEAIGQALKKNRYLTHLSIDVNPFLEISHSPRGRLRLADGFNENSSLKTLVISNSNIARLEFARLVIQVEKPKSDKLDRILSYSDDKANRIIQRIVEVWRQCKEAGVPLFRLKQKHEVLIDDYRKSKGVKDPKKREKVRQGLIEKLEVILKQVQIDEEESQVFKRAKVLVLGDKGSGKTSLINSLIARRASPTRDDATTVCVDVRSLVVEGTLCTVYDFGGHEEYKALPTFFLSQNCIVLLVVDLLKYNMDEESYSNKVQSWIDSIQSHIPGTKFFIVGTHGDAMVRDEKFKRADHIKECFDNVEEEVLQSFEQRLNQGNAQANPENFTEWFTQEDTNTRAYIINPREVIVDRENANPKSGLKKVAREENQTGIRSLSTRIRHFLGTRKQRDQPISQSELLNQIRESRPNLIDHVFCVSNKDYDGVGLLLAKLSELLKHPKYNASRRLSVPTVNLAIEIEERGIREPIMTVSDMIKAFANGGRHSLFHDALELKKALVDLHEMGQLLWYRNHEILSNTVFLSPRWVAEMIGSVIRHDMFVNDEVGISQVRAEFETEDELHEKIQRFKDYGLVESSLLFRLGRWDFAVEIDHRPKLLVLMDQLDLIAYTPETQSDSLGNSLVELFIPFYLQQSIRRKLRLKRRRLPPVPVQLVDMLSFQENRKHLDDIPDKDLKDKHVQYQYLFSNGFPEGLFLRLIVRIQPYVSMEYKRISEVAVAATDSTGSTYIIEEYRNYKGWNNKDLPGALLITGMSKKKLTKKSNEPFWNTMLLLSSEVESLLLSFTGLVSGVFIGFVSFGPDAKRQLVIGQRGPCEEAQQKYIHLGGVLTSNIEIEVSDSLRFPLTRILPELCEDLNYLDEKEEKKGKVEEEAVILQNPVMLKRKSYYAINMAVMRSFEQQLQNPELAKPRLRMMHVKLMHIIESLLRNLCVATGGDMYGSWKDYCNYLSGQIVFFGDDAASIQSFQHVDLELLNNKFIQFTVNNIYERIHVCKKLMLFLHERIKPDLLSIPGGYMI